MSWLECIECGETYKGDKPRYTCDCGALLDVKYDVTPSRTDFSGSLGVWRYSSLLPVDSHSTLQEGGTPLYDADKLSGELGVDLHIKHEGMNPTGSFKDRGMTVGVSKAIELGIERVACASTGNTSAALAAYGAGADIPAVVLLPQDKVAMGKIAQALMHGAEVLELDGNFDDCLDIVRSLGEKEYFYVLNSVNPYRLEGQKTIAFEVLEQLDWEIPDRVVLPVGNAGNISALHKGFRELYNAEVIDELPKMTGVQAKGASPFAHAVKKGGPLEPFNEPETKATAIRIGDPVNAPKARRAIEDTDGTATWVDDETIAEFQSKLASEEGIGVEPASATSVAGVADLIEAGEIDEGETVVSVATGHLLKDPDAALEASGRPTQADATDEAVIEALEE
ncbi:threonine synthase [Halorutilales archaeon Cl-col2-1]